MLFLVLDFSPCYNRGCGNGVTQTRSQKMTMVEQVLGLKVATGRALICVGEATKPLNIDALRQAIALRYDKDYAKSWVVTRTLSDSLSELCGYEWITYKFTLTDVGRRVFNILKSHEKGGATKFFRKSGSPNCGPTAPQEQPTTLMRAVHPSVPGLNSGTW